MEYSILQKIFNLGYARRQLNIILLIVCSFFLRNFIDIILYGLLKSGHPLIDFALSIAITVFLTNRSTSIGDVIKLFDDKFLILTNYIIDNYSFSRYQTIKRFTIFLSSLLLLIYLHFVEITSFWLMSSVVHFLICCIILEKIDDWQQYKGLTGKFRHYLSTLQNKTQIIILDDYNHKQLFKSSYEAPIMIENRPSLPIIDKKVKVNGHKIDATYP